MLGISSHGITDIGQLRSHNEDGYALDDDVQLYIVADGMGGHNFGEVASRMAIESVGRTLRSAPAVFGPAGSWCIPAFEPKGVAVADGLLPHSLRLKRSIEIAHDHLLAAVAEDAALLGMGTTIIAAMLYAETLTIAHVGDSRGYRLRGGVLELLTQDHTWVNDQVLAGYLSEEQARSHPLKSVVTRVLGGMCDADSFRVDVTEIEVDPGDLFLLCSDGLNGMVPDDEIARRMGADAPLSEVASQLVGDANGRGGFDNVTVVLLKAVEGQSPSPTALASPDASQPLSRSSCAASSSASPAAGVSG